MECSLNTPECHPVNGTERGESGINRRQMKMHLGYTIENDDADLRRIRPRNSPRYSPIRARNGQSGLLTRASGAQGEASGEHPQVSPVGWKNVSDGKTRLMVKRFSDGKNASDSKHSSHFIGLRMVSPCPVICSHLKGSSEIR